HEVQSPGESEEDVLAALDAAVAAFLDERVAAIGFGIPSNLERGTRRVLHATNLPLENIDLVARSRQRFGLPVAVENDASVAALAEWKRGAGRGSNNLVMFTLGTGVGGGIVIDGRLFRGWAELGHIVVQECGPPCTCGGRGHLEVLASGHAADGAACELYGPDADAHLLIDRGHAGDAAAVEALARIGASLGAAIGSLVNIFDPDLTVVGGGFGAAAGELVLGPAREAARREAIAPADETLRVVPAELGAEAGLVGAGLVGFEALVEH
ncbi:MAG TPA: ROK family protein, partial [Gaiellaceae bacterium]|nr:ROK family protein [Gaiellaceae bacterium]